MNCGPHWRACRLQPEHHQLPMTVLSSSIRSHHTPVVGEKETRIIRRASAVPPPARQECRASLIRRHRFRQGRTNVHRLLRGGSWNNTTSNLRCAYRNNNNPSNNNNNNGFRCARGIEGALDLSAAGPSARAYGCGRCPSLKPTCRCLFPSPPRGGNEHGKPPGQVGPAESPGGGRGGIRFASRRTTGVSWLVDAGRDLVQSNITGP
jgi:hypothetical protein